MDDANSGKQRTGIDKEMWEMKREVEQNYLYEFQEKGNERGKV